MARNDALSGSAGEQAAALEVIADVFAGSGAGSEPAAETGTGQPAGLGGAAGEAPAESTAAPAGPPVANAHGDPAPLAFAARLTALAEGADGETAAPRASGTPGGERAMPDPESRAAGGSAAGLRPNLSDLPKAARQATGTYSLPEAAIAFAVPPAARQSGGAAVVQPEASPGNVSGSAEPEARPAAAPPDSLRTLSLRLTETGRERVDVRLVEQAGEVKVAVHASDADLRRGLREGLSDLMGRLESNGYRAETWRPQEAASERNPSSGQQHTPDGRTARDQQQGRGRHPHPDSQPQWVDELEQRFRPPESNVERNISWLHPSHR